MFQRPILTKNLQYLIYKLLNKENLENKTKYFCSDSMMKYALREGLERAKRGKRELRENQKRELRESSRLSIRQIK